MPDYGEGYYEKQIIKTYEGWSNDDLRRKSKDVNAEMNGLRLAKNHLELLISERRNELDDMSFELLRRAKVADENRAD